MILEIVYAYLRNKIILKKGKTKNVNIWVVSRIATTVWDGKLKNARKINENSLQWGHSSEIRYVMYMPVLSK